MTTPSLFKQPSALLPLAMSLVATALFAYYVLTHGYDASAPPHDERAPARIWQLLMGLQLPIILWFAVRWLPRDPRRALIVLALQFVAGVTAVVPVVYFGG